MTSHSKWKPLKDLVIFPNFGIHAHRNVLHMNFQNCSITFKSFLKCYLGLVVIRKKAQNAPEVLQITFKILSQFFGNQCPDCESTYMEKETYVFSHLIQNLKLLWNFSLRKNIWEKIFKKTYLRKACSLYSEMMVFIIDMHINA